MSRYFAAAWRLVRKGYRIVVEVHEAYTLLTLLGITFLPATLLTYLGSLSALPPPALGAIFFVVFVSLGLLWLGALGYRRDRDAQRSSAGRPVRHSLSVSAEYIELPAATTKLYDAAISANSELVYAAEKTWDGSSRKASPDQVKNYIADYMVTRGATIYGVKHPSSIFGPIPISEIRSSKFVDGAVFLRDKFYDQSIYYKDLAIAAYDLQRLIDEEARPESEFSRAFNRTRRDKDGTLLDLVRLRDEGVRLRNNLPTAFTAEKFRAWADQVTRWMNDVAESLEIVSNADSIWFLTLDTVPAARVPIPNIRFGGSADRAEFESVFRQHDYRLARLDRLLKKHGVGA